MKALILVGGKGTRLQSVVSDLPKPLAPIAGKPFLEHQIEFLRRQGLSNIVLLTGHMAEKIRAQFGSAVSYSHESTPLGTGGAILQAMTEDGRYLVLNGDSILVTDYQKLVNEAKGPATLAAFHVADTSRFGRLDLEDDGRVRAFREKTDTAGAGWINAGVYVLERSIFKGKQGAFSLEKDVLPKLAGENKLRAVKCEGEFLDIGLPESLVLAQSLIPRWLS